MPDQPVFVHGRFSPRGVEWLRRVLAALFALLTHVEVHGLENLPPSGGFILAPNHLSRFDPPLMLTLLPGRRVTGFAADKYLRYPFFRWILESVDVIWVRRGAIGPSTIKAAMQALREGSILGVAPEGTRSPTHALQKGKTGAAFLAMAAGAPIVPVAITHTEKLGAALMRLRRIRLTVTFGEPLTFAMPKPDQRQAKLEEYTTEIMCRIAALLPPEYRGVYADHPRLKELLTSPLPPA